MGKPGAKVLPQTVTFREWVGGENATKFATREQVVAFHNLQLREQIVPLIKNALARYDAEQRARSPSRRLYRWVRRVLGRPMTHDELVEEVFRAEQRRHQREAEPETAPAVASTIAMPAEQGARPRSCVVCGSVQLEPLNENGGLVCPRGHVVEEPPPETAIATVKLVEDDPPRVMDAAQIEDRGRDPAGSPGGLT